MDVIVQRWQTLSGKKATLDGDGRTFDEDRRGAEEGGRMNAAPLHRPEIAEAEAACAPAISRNAPGGPTSRMMEPAASCVAAWKQSTEAP